MRIGVTEVPVDDHARWLTVVSPEQSAGPELRLGLVSEAGRVVRSIAAWVGLSRRAEA
jgi:hypothetical protein